MFYNFKRFGISMRNHALSAQRVGQLEYSDSIAL